MIKEKIKRCFRCHGFGHITTACGESDLTGTWRKCGTSRHLEKACTVPDKVCVACERADIKAESHRTDFNKFRDMRAAARSSKGKEGRPQIEPG